MSLDDFAEFLPDDPRQALCKVAEKFKETRAFAHQEGESMADYRDDYFSLLALSQILIDQLEDVKLRKPDLNCNTVIAMQRIERYFDNLYMFTDPIVNQSYLDEITKKHEASLGIGHFYEFSDADLSRIQQLVNELRDIVTQSTYFDEDHRRRLLRRLERLQLELHKKMSDLDRFWGLIGDAGVALGKFGQDAKPFVDRIKELWEIVWRAQAEAEKLPQDSKMPLLPDQR